MSADNTNVLFFFESYCKKDNLINIENIHVEPMKYSTASNDFHLFCLFFIFALRSIVGIIHAAMHWESKHNAVKLQYVDLKDFIKRYLIRIFCAVCAFGNFKYTRIYSLS